MERRGRTGSKHSSRKEDKTKRRDFDDSDEDYLVEEDEIGEQSEELESLVADESEEESFYSFEEEEDEYEEEEDDKEEVEVELKEVVKTKARKGASKPSKKGIKRSWKRRMFMGEEEDEDYDEDDKEFTPDEIDSLDDEEELPFLKIENKSRGRPPLKKKASTKRKRRKTTARRLVRKTSQKVRKTGSSLRRKACFGINEDSMRNIPILRGKSKRKAKQRKNDTITCSDLDFVSSESSDYDFTISEEEREQIREANEILFRSLNANLRSSMRIKEVEALHQPRKPPRRKGKEKADDIKNGGGKQVCGICLTWGGKNTVRGTLNCCSHYFCFACIMEWSKVETRCPLCKQRFVTISKPASSVTGIDSRNVVILVPERNQVCQPSEEEIRDYLDPYENVICTECHQGGDDALMLL